MSEAIQKQPADNRPCHKCDQGRRYFIRSTVLGTLAIAATRPASSAWTFSKVAAYKDRASELGTKGSQHHEDYMRRAIAMAQKVPELPFGAVIVRRTTGEIIAEGFNRSAESPTFHGEIDAINRCAAAHRSVNWADLDLYTTAEPCPMCQSAIEWAGIANVYYGTSIPYLQSRGWWQINIRAEEVARRTPFRQTKVVGGILEAECNALFEAAPRGYFRK